jgi:RHH-type proline utilization regulon transcriptional repressor/proline dehydrogenase/delta 1-pyrroline-5-carboxylate dehydrogenase
VLIEALGSYESLKQPLLSFIAESQEHFVKRIGQQPTARVRLLSPASHHLKIALAEMGARVLDAPVLANGRLELLHYLREISLSVNYHRYGNLGTRETEKRSPLPQPVEK